jgi:tRNA 2-thiouridine synthesizing protein D
MKDKPYRFVLVVLAGPYSKQSAYTAFRFAESLLILGHHLECVFFYGDGVIVGNPLLSPPSDESNLYQLWQNLAQVYSVPLLLCVTEAMRRGVANKSALDALASENSSTPSKSAGFLLAGLGQFFATLQSTDRLIIFGN